MKKNSKCLRKLSKIQVNTERQLNELRRTIHEQNKKFDKLVEMIKKKKNQSEIPELENTKIEMKSEIEKFNSRLNKAKKAMCELEHRSLDIFQSKKKM